MTSSRPHDEEKAISHISGLVLINAMIFHEILASIEKKIIPLSLIIDDKDPIPKFCDYWQRITTEIDYYPIFHIAREILLNLSSSPDTTQAIRKLAEKAREITSRRSALQHDLMGRIYHRLLLEAKYLGTYYTKIPSATILLKLCLQPNRWPIAWHDLEEIGNLRISDLACGTGTLLLAAADAITDNYINATVVKGKGLHIGKLQNTLAENVLYGYDVLPSAIHLTASTLAIRSPEVPFKKMNLFSLTLGGENQSLGSIDFLSGQFVPMVDLFGTMPGAQQIGGDKLHKVDLEKAVLPQLDLCVMNPPFTRSVGGNLLFGSLPEKERVLLQKKLKNLVKKQHVRANITAGLGSVFVATAHYYIKPGGRLALVLPKALLSGAAWKETRDLISSYYELEFMITSHDPNYWNFSESTDLSEVMVVARKKDKPNFEQEDSANQNKKGKVVALNLWKNPQTPFESLAVADSILLEDSPDIEETGTRDIKIGDQKVGEAIQMKWETLIKRSGSDWLLPCAFAHTDLSRIVYHLEQGSLQVPGHFNSPITLCALRELGTLGPDRRDIHDGFETTPSPTFYPTFWGHEANKVLSLAQQPNLYLNPLSKPKPGRNLRNAATLWNLAGKILLAERLRLNTIRLVAVRFEENVLSNVWWTFKLNAPFDGSIYEKAITLWLNSSLGLLLLLSRREETMGAWVDFKKPNLQSMPVADIRKIEKEKLTKLETFYDQLANQMLLPLPEMKSDPVRAQIDAAIAEALALPDFTIIRNLLSYEPVINLKPLVP